MKERPAFTNLSQMAAQPLIRYLCRHKDEDPDWLPLARTLNRWVEDQFVHFGPDNESAPRPARGPLVFEQFGCWHPMEAHTGNWLQSLIALHQASGEREYLDKARAAANAICYEQFPDGQFSTWSRAWPVDQSPAAIAGEIKKNWFNCNAMADAALYKLAAYAKNKAQD